MASNNKKDNKLPKGSQGKKPELSPIQSVSGNFSYRQAMVNLINESLWDSYGVVTDVDKLVGAIDFPRIDLSESSSELCIVAEIPGMSENDINLEVNESSVSISGVTKNIQEERGDSFFKSERHFGRFHRMIDLPVEISRDETKAEYQNGILTIKLQKKTSSSRKKINIIKK